jgi:hypothetical protein
MLGHIPHKLIAVAHASHRNDLAALFDRPADEPQQRAKSVTQAIDIRAPRAR